MSEIDYEELVANIDMDELASFIRDHISEADIAEAIDLSDLATEIDLGDLANEVAPHFDLSEIEFDPTEHWDSSDLASCFSESDIADYISVDDVASAIDLDDLSASLLEQTCMSEMADKVMSEHMEEAGIDYEKIARKIVAQDVAPHVSINAPDVARYIDHQSVANCLNIDVQILSDRLSEDNELHQYVAMRSEMHRGVAGALDTSQVAKNVQEPWSFLCDKEAGLTSE